MQGDSVTAVAAFLVDAARGDVSDHTVIQVLLHWVSEGLSAEEIHKAVAVAGESCPARNRKALEALGLAIKTRFT